MLERRRMAEEAGFLHGQVVHQVRPLDGATRPGGHLLVVAGIAAQLQLAQTSRQNGLQKRAALLVEHDAATGFQQFLPGAEFRCRDIGQRLHRPDRAWLHAAPLVDAHPAAALSGCRAPWPQACSRSSGRVKPDTDLRMSLAILARVPMLRAVAVVPDEVWVVIS
ncbi:hypothetical protein D3C75_887780 [compost metagenome]